MKKHWYRQALTKGAKPGNNFVRWIRLNGFDREDIWRALAHVPVGALAAWLCGTSPKLGIPFFVGFLVYEVVEDWRIKDRGYKDIFGFLCGYGVVASIIVGAGIWNLSG